jgi:thioesterase domain-containing protein
MISLMTLASWGVVWLHLQAAGLDADVFVADSEVRYLRPLFADLEVSASLAGDAGWDVFAATLRERGRARATLAASVALPDGGVAAQCSARYVAIARR